MLVTLAGMVTVVSAVQFPNASEEIDLTPAPMFTSCNDLQLWNAQNGIVETLPGIVMLVSPVPSKA